MLKWYGQCMFAELTYIYRYLASIYNKLLPDIVVAFFIPLLLRVFFFRRPVSIVLLHFIKNPMRTENEVYKTEWNEILSWNVHFSWFRLSSNERTNIADNLPAHTQRWIKFRESIWSGGGKRPGAIPLPIPLAIGIFISTWFALGVMCVSWWLYFGEWMNWSCDFEWISCYRPG